MQVRRQSFVPAARALPAALLVAAAAAQAQPAPPCQAPDFAQFDFWLGDWTVRWTDKDKGELAGSNRIRKTHDGCVIVEEFDGRPGTPLRGMSAPGRPKRESLSAQHEGSPVSVSTFVPRAGRWKQTWVDNSGSYLDFEGEFRDGKMILSRRAPLAGPRVQQRMIFADITPSSLTWDWQISKNDGATWQTAWRLLYTRR